MDLQKLWAKIKSDRFLFAGCVVTAAMPVLIGFVTVAFYEMREDQISEMTFSRVYYNDGTWATMFDFWTELVFLASFFSMWLYMPVIALIACVRSAITPSKLRHSPDSDKSPDHQ